jgi:hypothetical protein
MAEYFSEQFISKRFVISVLLLFHISSFEHQNQRNENLKTSIVNKAI